MQHLQGIGVSAGIASSKAELIKPSLIEVEKKQVEDTAAEWQRVEAAKKTSIEQLEEIYQHTLNNIGKKEAEIFAAHLMIMQDEEFFGPIKQLIENNKCNAEWALKEVGERFIKMFADMDNLYMQERAADIKDVVQRLLRILSGTEKSKLGTEKSIIVAHDLTPSETARFNKKDVLGLIMEVGGKTSHSAIIARSLGIPAVVGVKGILEKINKNDELIIDGSKGEIYLNPDQVTLAKYQELKNDFLQEQEKYMKIKGSSAITKDGHKFELAGNIGLPSEVEMVLENEGEGIGLFRTEFLYMERNSFPTEEEQFKAYQLVAKKMQGKPVIIRTLDIGGDKDLSYFDFPEESNPFLGFRAIRLSLERTDLFKTQLRAILRASNYGHIKIMFPMISTVQELRGAKSFVNDAKEELQTEGIPFAEDIEIGMMMETPAAAVMSDEFAKLVDFFSIGTNDLIQYTIAVDRMNARVANLYSPFNPAVLRLIKEITENAHQEGIWVGICGEAARIPALIPYYVGLGVDELSMSAGSILESKWIIQQLDTSKLVNMMRDIENMDNTAEIKSFLEASLAKLS